MKIRQTAKETLLVIPKGILTYMGWKAGDKVVILADKKNKKIVYKKVEE